MNPNRSIPRLTAWGLCPLAVMIVTLLSVSALSQEPKPGQAPAEAQTVERKAKDLQAADRTAKAEKAERDAKELRDNADRPEKDPSAKTRAKDKRWIEAKRELRKAQEALKQLQNEGKGAEADEIERRVKKLETKLDRLERAPEGDRGDEPEWRGPRPPGDRPETAEWERRLRHLQVAVENLHAAGLHDVADKLAREGERMRQEFGDEARAGLRGPMPPGPEVEQLRAELEELRETVKDLRDRVETLRKER